MPGTDRDNRGQIWYSHRLFQVTDQTQAQLLHPWNISQRRQSSSSGVCRSPAEPRALLGAAGVALAALVLAWLLDNDDDGLLAAVTGDVERGRISGLPGRSALKLPERACGWVSAALGTDKEPLADVGAVCLLDLVSSTPLAAHAVRLLLVAGFWVRAANSRSTCLG